MRFSVEPMRLDDVDEVIEVEKVCFSLPWPLHAYRRELQDNRTSRYIVARMINGPAESLPARIGSSHGHPTLRQTISTIFHPFSREATPDPAAPLPARIAGYGGLWFMLDEAHITTIGVRPDLRHYGIGELLLASLLHIASDLGAARMPLEVRVSNLAAQNLYRKYGFMEEGRRRRYYSDNNEDALIMWSDPLDSPEFRRRLNELETALTEHLEGSLLKSAFGQGIWAPKLCR